MCVLEVFFYLLLLFCLLSNTFFLPLWKLKNYLIRAKNSNPVMCSFFTVCVSHSVKSSAYLSCKVCIFRLCRLLFLSLHTLTSERKMTSVSPNVSPPSFYNSSCHLQLLSQKHSVGMMAAFSCTVGVKRIISYGSFTEGCIGHSTKYYHVLCK